MKLYTTLNIIRQHNPCKDSWEKALRLLGKTKPDDDPLSFEWILDNMGVCDAIWGLQAVRDEDRVDVERDARLFACDCAESVLDNFESEHPQDGRVRECINVSKLFARGETNDKARSAARSAACEAARSAACEAARSAAYAAARSAEWSAARSAAGPEARSAARSAAESAEREKQSEIFRKYFCD
jgi:chemotaxis protein histidine kinase CheA